MNRFQKPVRQPDYQLEEIEGELLLYHPAQSRIVYCNQTAALVWQLSDGRHTVAQISHLLSQAYPEAAETIPVEVESTLRQLANHGAIEFK